MVDLPRLVTVMISVQPAATASSTPYWMRGLSTRQSISFGMALVAGRKRVPRPAAGKTALRIFWVGMGWYGSRFQSSLKHRSKELDTAKIASSLDAILDQAALVALRIMLFQT